MLLAFVYDTVDIKYIVMIFQPHPKFYMYKWLDVPILLYNCKGEHR